MTITFQITVGRGKPFPSFANRNGYDEPNSIQPRQRGEMTMAFKDVISTNLQNNDASASLWKDLAETHSFLQSRFRKSNHTLGDVPKQFAKSDLDFADIEMVNSFVDPVSDSPSIPQGFPLFFSFGIDEKTEKTNMIQHVLQSEISLDTLLTHVKSISDMSTNSPGKNRAFGSVANYQIIHYIYRQLQFMGGYKLTLEPVTLKQADLAIGTLQVDGKMMAAAGARFSPKGTVIGELVDLENNGCSTVKMMVCFDFRIYSN